MLEFTCCANGIVLAAPISEASWCFDLVLVQLTGCGHLTFSISRVCRWLDFKLIIGANGAQFALTVDQIAAIGRQVDLKLIGGTW